MSHGTRPQSARPSRQRELTVRVRPSSASPLPRAQRPVNSPRVHVSPLHSFRTDHWATEQDLPDEFTAEEGTALLDWVNSTLNLDEDECCLHSTDIEDAIRLGRILKYAFPRNTGRLDNLNLSGHESNRIYNNVSLIVSVLRRELAPYMQRLNTGVPYVTYKTVQTEHVAFRVALLTAIVVSQGKDNDAIFWDGIEKLPNATRLVLARLVEKYGNAQLSVAFQPPERVSDTDLPRNRNSSLLQKKPLDNSFRSQLIDIEVGSADVLQAGRSASPLPEGSVVSDQSRDRSASVSTDATDSMPEEPIAYAVVKIVEARGIPDAPASISELEKSLVIVLKSNAEIEGVRTRGKQRRRFVRWNEEHPVKITADPQEAIVMSIKSVHSFGESLLADVSIPVETILEVPSDQARYEWYTLSPSASLDTGGANGTCQVRTRIYFSESNPHASNAGEVEDMLDWALTPTTMRSRSLGTLVLTVVEARNLATASIMSKITGVRCHLDFAESRGHTRMMPPRLHTKWEEDFSFPLPSRDHTQLGLSVIGRLQDREVMIGTADVDISKIFGKEHIEMLPCKLTPGPEGFRTGTVYIDVTFVPRASQMSSAGDVAMRMMKVSSVTRKWRRKAQVSAGERLAASKGLTSAQSSPSTARGTTSHQEAVLRVMNNQVAAGSIRRVSVFDSSAKFSVRPPAVAGRDQIVKKGMAGLHSGLAGWDETSKVPEHLVNLTETVLSGDVDVRSVFGRRHFRGTLIIGVVEAQNVTAPEETPREGRCRNVYCVLQYGNQQKTTNSVYKSLRPRWGQVFPIDLDFEDDRSPDQSVQVTVVGERRGGSPIVLGDRKIPLHRLVEFEEDTTRWYTLDLPVRQQTTGPSPEKLGSGVTGGPQLKMTIRFEPTDLGPIEPPSEGPDPVALRLADTTMHSSDDESVDSGDGVGGDDGPARFLGRMRVRVIDVDNVTLPHGEDPSTSRLICLLRLGDQEEKSRQKHVTALEPQFDELFSFDLNTVAKRLRLELKAKTPSRTVTILGHVSIRIGPIMEATGREIELSQDLIQPTPLGDIPPTVRLVLDFTPAEELVLTPSTMRSSSFRMSSELSTIPRTSTSTVTAPAASIGELRVRILEGLQLFKPFTGDTAAHVRWKLRLRGREWKTETKTKGRLPRWNELLTIPISPADAREHRFSLSFSVKSFDGVRSLGTTSIDFLPLIEEPDEQFESWFDVVDSATGGRVRLRMVFAPRESAEPVILDKLRPASARSPRSPRVTRFETTRPVSASPRGPARPSASLGNLRVGVIEGENIARHNVRGKGMYCVLNFGTLEAITDKQPVALRPEWNEHAVFPVHTLSSDLTIKLIVVQNVGKRRVHGTCTIALDDLYYQHFQDEGEVMSNWYELLTPMESQQTSFARTLPRSLHVSLSFEPTALFYQQFQYEHTDVTRDGLSDNDLLGHNDAATPLGELYFTFVRGTFALPDTDYVQVTIRTSNAEAKSTRQPACEAEWNEERVLAIHASDTIVTLAAVLKGANGVSRNLGEVKLLVADVVNAEEPVEQWLQLALRPASGQLLSATPPRVLVRFRFEALAEAGGLIAQLQSLQVREQGGIRSPARPQSAPLGRGRSPSGSRARPQSAAPSGARRLHTKSPIEGGIGASATSLSSGGSSARQLGNVFVEIKKSRGHVMPEDGGARPEIYLGVTMGQSSLKSPKAVVSSQKLSWDISYDLTLTNALHDDLTVSLHQSVHKGEPEVTGRYKFSSSEIIDTLKARQDWVQLIDDDGHDTDLPEVRIRLQFIPSPVFAELATSLFAAKNSPHTEKRNMIETWGRSIASGQGDSAQSASGRASPAGMIREVSNVSRTSDAPSKTISVGTLGSTRGVTVSVPETMSQLLEDARNALALSDPVVEICTAELDRVLSTAQLDHGSFYYAALAGELPT